VFPMSGVQPSAEGSIPDTFIDLPTAVDIAQRSGMRAKRIKEAELRWTSGQVCGSFRETNAILPPCNRGRSYVGWQWELTPEFGGRVDVPAVSPR